MQFIHNEPAIFYKGALIIGDTHFGIEEKLKKKGIHQNNLSDILYEKAVKLLEQTKAKKLIIVGDVKDNILSLDNKTKNILQKLSLLVQVIIVKGNHDGNIDQISNIIVYSPKGFVFHDIGFVHGHAFPDEKLMNCKYIVSAHQHIQYDFRDKNKVHTEKVWAVLDPNEKEISIHYKTFNKKIKLILMPAFNFLVGKSLKNGRDKHLGPLFNNKLFKWDHAILYRLDGICLGKIYNK